MKKVVAVLMLFAVISFTLPIAAFYLTHSDVQGQKLDLDIKLPSRTNTAKAEELVTLLDEATGQLITMDLRTFLIGSVASEMPAEYSEQALMAQAIACHSYALATKAVNEQKDDFTGAWRTVDTAKKEGYITEDVMRVLWQESYDEYYNKIALCVDTVIDKIAVYDNTAALTAYHAISCGQTENSKNVWQNELPYLVTVESMLDVTAPDFLASQSFTPQQMVDALSVNFTGLDLSGNPSGWISEIIYSDAGYATDIKMNNGAVISAKDFRQALGLRSTALEIEYADDRFVVTTKGYGHGVGMSQYGANAMAVTGKTYEEILKHYFSGIEIKTA